MVEAIKKFQSERGGITLDITNPEDRALGDRGYEDGVRCLC